MSQNKQNGDKGEQEVVDLVPCPNCGKALMRLPTGYPLYDVQCVGCNFRAQVKTNKIKPTVKEIHGAGWEIVEKVLKSGFLMPPLIANFKWKEKGIDRQEIRFYPFVPKKNLKKYLADIKSRDRKYWMFNYINLNELPHFVVYKS